MGVCVDVCGGGGKKVSSDQRVSRYFVTEAVIINFNLIVQPVQLQQCRIPSAREGSRAGRRQR